jgi:hypothetical protein
VPQPRFEIIPAAAPAGTIRRAAETVGPPCVVKAISLSTSQGVLRAGDAAEAVIAAGRIRHLQVIRLCAALEAYSISGAHFRWCAL